MEFASLINGVIVSILVLLVGAGATWIATIKLGVGDWLKANATETQRQLLSSVIRTGVGYAEQYFASEEGLIKKRAALTFIEAELERLGFPRIDSLVLTAYLEDAVRDLNIFGPVMVTEAKPE